MSVQTSLYKRNVVCVDSRSRDNYSASVSVWSGPGVIYAVGDRVYLNAAGYRCTVGHTSSALFETDLNLGRWVADASTTTSSNYKVKFPALRNVKMLRLLTTEIPNTQYVINHKNRWLDFFDTFTGLSYSVALGLGTYTAAALANEINTQMNAALGLGFGVGLTVAYLTTPQKILITRLAPGTTIQLLWRTGTYGSAGRNMSCATVLGWPGTADTAVATAQLAPNLVSLVGESYVNLVIKGYPALSTSEAGGDVFARIIWENIPRNYNYNTFASNAIIYPIAKDVVDNFEVSFLEYNNKLYDFNGVEHSFTVEAFCE